MRATPPLRRSTASLVVAAALLAGCFGPTQPGGPTGRRPTADPTRPGAAPEALPTVAPGATAAPTAAPPTPGVAPTKDPGAPPIQIDAQKFLLGRVFAPTTILSNNGGSVIGQNGAGVIGQNGAGVIGQNGAGVIGQNGAGVIGQNGAGVIGQNGAGVIGQNGAGIVSNNGGSLGQHALAYASVKVVDAAGKPKLGKNGEPLEGKADRWGQFLLPRAEIDANSVIQVTSPYIQGEMKAFVPRNAATPAQELEVDIVSTLATTYVLDKYVAGEQATLDKLTPDIEQEARQDVKQAYEKQLAPLVDTTEPARLVAAVDGLIGKDPAVDDVFERIERLLVVVGLVKGGAGMPALEVDIGQLDGVLPTPEGVIAFHRFTHTLRLIDADGIVRQVVPSDGWGYPEWKPTAIDAVYRPRTTGMAYHAGALYLADTDNHRVVRIRGGAVEVLAGTGTPGGAGVGGVARQAQLSFPTGLAVAADGTVYVADSGNDLVKRFKPGGPLAVAAGGGTKVDAGTAVPAAEVALGSPQGLAFDAAGDLWIADHDHGRVRRLTATGLVVDGTAPDALLRPIGVAVEGGVAYGLDHFGSQVHVIRPDGVAPVPGLATSSFPLAFAAAGGQLYYQDGGGRLVRVAAAGGEPTPVAGKARTAGVDELEQAFRMAFNAVGDLAIADYKGCKIYLKPKDGPLALVAGNGAESPFVDAAADAKATPIGNPTDVEWDGPGHLKFTAEGSRPCVRRVALTGALETLAGNGKFGYEGEPVGDARNASFQQPLELTTLDDGRTVIFEPPLRRAYALDAAGEALTRFTAWPSLGSWVRGVVRDGDRHVMLDLDGKRVVAVRDGAVTTLATSTDLAALGTGELKAVAFDRKGRLYVGSLVKIIQKDLETGVVRTLAGEGGAILNQAARDTSLRTLMDLQLSPDGDLYVLETTQVKRIPRSVLESF